MSIPNKIALLKNGNKTASKKTSVSTKVKPEMGVDNFVKKTNMTAGVAYADALMAGRVVRVKKGQSIVDVHPDKSEVWVKNIDKTEKKMDGLKNKLVSLGTFTIGKKTK